MSTHECLAALAVRGHHVDVVPYMMSGYAYALDDVNVHPGAELTAFAPEADVVVSHLGDDGRGSKLAHSLGIPSVRMVHGQPGSQHRLNDDLAVFNSDSLKASVAWPGRSIVVRPPVHPDEYRTTPGDSVTLVNLAVAKGGHALYTLAKLMPDVPFLGVRGGYGQQVSRKAPPNLTVMDSTSRMVDDVYARTRVLLMPSRRESWGRTAIEAAASGIPTIAAPTPGLMESLGSAGTFVELEDTAGWVAAIRHLLTPEGWLHASTRALARSAELDPTADLAAFTDALEAITCEPSCSRPVGVMVDTGTNHGRGFGNVGSASTRTFRSM